MAETRTPRLGLPQWSSGQTDSPSRDDFNEAFANLEKWAARFEVGTLATRPNPEIAGRYYVDEAGTIYRDTGTAWTQIGTPKNSLKITKDSTSGLDPAFWADVPSALGADAFRSTHDGKVRFRVSPNGSVVGSSVRLYHSDTLPPDGTLNLTLGLNTKAASASGLTIFGQPGQAGNLIENKTNTGADLSLMTASGDVMALGRVAAGSLVPTDAQVLAQSTTATRPALVARTQAAALSDVTVAAYQTADGKQLWRVDGQGRAAIGFRDSATLLAGDGLAVNTNFTGQNSGSTTQAQSRLVFRNRSVAAGVAGLQIAQEPGDGASAASLSLFAGLAADGGLAPERVRFGITPDKHGARFTSDRPDWTPLVARGAAGQTALLLDVQKSDGTSVAQINPNGDLRVTRVAVTSTDPAAFGGDLNVGGDVNAQSFYAAQGAGTDVGYTSQIKKSTTQGKHFLARDESGVQKAAINLDGTLVIADDLSAVPAGAVVLTMRGQQYRQQGRKLQSYDQAAQRWGSFESANSAEYYTQQSQNVANAFVPINWFGEVNDTESAYGFTSGSPVITVPFTGLYDVRALAHVSMNFTGSGTATFRVNGNIEMKYRRDFPRALGWDVCTLSLNDLLLLNAGDRLEFMVKIDSFIFSTTTLNTGDYRSRLSIRFAGNP